MTHLRRLWGTMWVNEYRGPSGRVFSDDLAAKLFPIYRCRVFRPWRWVRGIYAKFRVRCAVRGSQRLMKRLMEEAGR